MRLTLEIKTDGFSRDVNPREDCDNLGTFWTWHKRYASPDRDAPNDPMPRLPNRSIGLPVWMYDHSGVAYRAAVSNPFSCPWDSGQVGWIFVDRKKAAEWFGWKRTVLNKKRRDRILKQLALEVEIYNAWVNGNVWDYGVYDEDGHYVEGCGGFILHNDEAREDLIRQAMAELESCVREALS